MAVRHHHDATLLRLRGQVLADARAGRLNPDWRAAMVARTLASPPRTPAPGASPDPYATVPVHDGGVGIFAPAPPRPTPAASVLDAVVRSCIRHWTAAEAAEAIAAAGDVDIAATCAALDVAGRGRPVAAWEPGAGVGWRAALDAWRDAALAVHRQRARIARRAARRWAGQSTDPASVLAATGMDIVGERDRIELMTVLLDHPRGGLETGGRRAYAGQMQPNHLPPPWLAPQSLPEARQPRQPRQRWLAVVTLVVGLGAGALAGGLVAGSRQHAPASQSAPAAAPAGPVSIAVPAVPDPVCAEWAALANRYADRESEWSASDPSIPGAQWSPEQAALTARSVPILRADAADMRRLGQQARDPLMSSLLLAEAAYADEFIDRLGPGYRPTDHSLWQASTDLGRAVRAVCAATK